MSVSITGNGMAIAITGKVGLTYDRKTKVLEVTGLTEHDRVVHRTKTGGDLPYEQSVRIELK
ncbi:hypothetical protein PBI_WINKY_79 [Mycobacterium phage Winky]|uniref:Uncharacterized protein n=1 Tax=Mycobacterium phage Faith1 TaxID=2920893 RepID=F6M874_9CAUD|nr:hypothetical protein SEA_FAITH1_79 [Mycobacterium phage Faith1]AGK87642.1 hypothetical protein PBI_WINKY_79 [Mycobacterium phage Winky]AGM12688.1 hypothetical protein PBI_BREEZONA_79 [Mycobacterium phage Breezona]ASM62685.1 hypothetical protein SEA_MILEY16_79 [Mycobacterium phage Miley16]AYN57125.1 hypothetical protein PBI_BIGCHEESE_79 [Mycobacterium phage BigCheese]QGJ93952.1 hypothetical protein SEA_BOBSGARAGE_79 [Mycobacterium phage BobsGarage]QGZ16591.1 hypothetical protein PBI_GABRIEL